jgi:hypothetical protein
MMTIAVSGTLVHDTKEAEDGCDTLWRLTGSKFPPDLTSPLLTTG